MMRRSKAHRSREQIVLRAWRSNGYVRVPNLDKRADQGSQRYKKGYEVRIVLDDGPRVAVVRRALVGLGFRPGRLFRKRNKIVVPIYGQAAVEWFVGNAD